jgi:hypothetical protein
MVSHLQLPRSMGTLFNTLALGGLSPTIPIHLTVSPFRTAPPEGIKKKPAGIGVAAGSHWVGLAKGARCKS